MVKNLYKLSEKAAHIKTNTYVLEKFLLFPYVFMFYIYS